jgi:hypothetical protein
MGVSRFCTSPEVGLFVPIDALDYAHSASSHNGAVLRSPSKASQCEDIKLTP